MNDQRTKNPPHHNPRTHGRYLTDESYILERAAKQTEQDQCAPFVTTAA